MKVIQRSNGHIFYENNGLYNVYIFFENQVYNIPEEIYNKNPNLFSVIEDKQEVVDTQPVVTEPVKETVTVSTETQTIETITTEEISQSVPETVNQEQEKIPIQEQVEKPPIEEQQSFEPKVEQQTKQKEVEKTEGKKQRQRISDPEKRRT